MNTEIEIKLFLTPNDRKKVTQWLKINAKKEGTIHHVEYYLNNPQSSFTFTSKEGYKDALDYLRIRFTDKGDSVCLKHWHRDPITTKTTHCDEFETPVKDGKTLLELYKAIGFTDNVILDKTRTTYNSTDFEIVIDEVKGIGQFMEVELKKKVANANIGLKNINDFLRQLGLKKYIKMERGYVSMLWNPGYDFGEEISLL